MPESKVSKVPKQAKRPTDHKAKGDDGLAVYQFDWNGKTYALPPPDSGINKVPGKALRDAYMDGDEGQMRLGFQLLELVDTDADVIDALYSMPAPQMLDHIQKWMELRSSQTAATVGESSRSLS